MSREESETNAAAAPKRKPRGRPAAVCAEAHDKILDAVEAILTEKSLRDLTIEEVARRAGVGKPTIYKWWPSKQALALDLFEDRIVGSLIVPDNTTAEEAIRSQAAQLVRLLQGFFGRVSRQLIAEGQSDPEVMREYRDRYLKGRRAFTAKMIEQAKASGEFRADTDADLLIDMIYGTIYYRLLIGHLPLDEAFGQQVVNSALEAVKTQ